MHACKYNRSIGDYNTDAKIIHNIMVWISVRLALGGADVGFPCDGIEPTPEELAVTQSYVLSQY